MLQAIKLLGKLERIASCCGHYFFPEQVTKDISKAGCKKKTTHILHCHEKKGFLVLSGFATCLVLGARCYLANPTILDMGEKNTNNKFHNQMSRWRATVFLGGGGGVVVLDWSVLTSPV